MPIKSRYVASTAQTIITDTARDKWICTARMPLLGPDYRPRRFVSQD